MSQSSIRNLIIALIIFTLVIGVGAFTFVNLLKNSRTLEGQIAVVAAQNQQEETMIRLQKVAKNSETERGKLAEYFLFRESDTINFLGEIEDNLAPNLGVLLETSDLKQLRQDNKDWIEVTFDTSGSRENLQHFITALESVPFASRISKVDMRGNRESGWQANIVIQVQLLAYDQ